MNKEFWQNRWQTNQTGWDLGEPSRPLIEYANSLKITDLRILIPGCGSGHEAGWLLENGFSDITLSEISPEAVARLRQKFGDRLTVVEGDFFELPGEFDLIFEQTFFCALPPARRPDYVLKMSELLRPGGRLVGVLFDCDFEKAGPPFGGSREEYVALFGGHFHFSTFEPCRNSAAPRAGSELFIDFLKA